MITEADDGRNSDQIQGCTRTLHVSSAVVTEYGNDPALAPSRFRGHRWINPTTQEECGHHLDEVLVQEPSGRPWERPSSPSEPQATPSGIFCHAWVQSRAARGCEPPQGDGVIRIRRNALSPWSREDHPECQASSLLERTKEEVVNTRQVAKVRGTLKGSDATPN
jgi:hypothetical protein